MDNEDNRKEFQNILEQLKAPIPDLQTLLCLLSTLLEAYGLLPPKYRVFLHSSALGFVISSPSKTLPQIQHILLVNILPTWDILLNENDDQDLVDQFFVPNAFSNASFAAGNAALCAYGILLVILSGKHGQPSVVHAVRLLERLMKEYPIDRMYNAASISASSKRDIARRDQQWEDCVKDLCMVPAKVANALLHVEGGSVPDVLENANYFSALSGRVEELVFSLSSTSNPSECVEPLAYLFQKLVNIGLFPPDPPISRSQLSFFLATLPRIRQRLASSSSAYSSLWREILTNLPALALQSILTSLFGSLQVTNSSTDPLTADSKTRALIKREATLLDNLVGKLIPEQEKEKTELWDIATSLMLSKNWNETYARIFVCWVSGGVVGTLVNLPGNVALEAFLEIVLERWGSSEHIKHSLISRHHYTTLLFVLTTSYFAASSSTISFLVSSPIFIRGISTYISHLDVSVRRCGMLAAEVAANLTGKKLDFGGWEGYEGNKMWAKDVRTLIEKRDVDAKLEILEEDDGAKEDLASKPTTTQTTESMELKSPTVTFPTSGYDSDDSLTGYASPSSSRSPSPTPSSLDEIEKDPTLNVGRKKVLRPVYLAQLGDLLRGTGTQMQHKADEPHDADKIEMALAVGEELIRRKRNYGTELDENAVNLVYAFIGLNDNFDLDGFSEKRQAALNALISCSPRKAAPSIIEEFFKNQYSTDQRFVVLNALALGARELASLPTPLSVVPSKRTAFPSKKLPTHLHRRYINENQIDKEVVPRLMDDIAKHVLKDEHSAVETQPEVIRERRLRIQKPPTRITEVVQQHPLNPYSNLEQSIPKPKTRFIDVAAECFIIPLVNRFWSFLRDEQAREERTASREGSGRYHGAGTGLIMNPVVLAQFLRTLAILVNASQNAPEWLALIAPDALELALTIGTKPISHVEMAEDELETEEQRKMKEASVLTSSLELALIVLDGALEIDGGKILGLEHTTLVLGTGEWAGKVFANLEKGLKVQGGGGMHEARLNRAAAGVLLKVDELGSKWRRSMLDLR
ncbi:telomere length regulation protein-domain-containing protein [Crepidotus variabilis]|uniref:Telomere length regulation protein-domain-containing protein n=1 Tax=Crepidotus variabilis TaxID=179855 RepID=A0A9P6JVD9_9AGAR|nr:telomere length regulation protein-domain-containing protein [Crepidotus variabilis]